VDDLMFVGGPKFWKESVLGKFKEHFTISHDELEGIGSSVGFLKRKIVKIDRGLGLVSGGNAQKAVLEETRSHTLEMVQIFILSFFCRFFCHFFCHFSFVCHFVCHFFVVFFVISVSSVIFFVIFLSFFLSFQFCLSFFEEFFDIFHYF